jgi:peptide/nickel transport system substrate-binding protein
MAIVILLIIIVAGVAGYVALSANHSSTTQTSSESSASSSSAPPSSSISGASSSVSSNSIPTSGNTVPNQGVLVEENTIQPGPGGLDPALTWDYSDMWFLNVYENLVHWNGSNPTQFIPWLAQSWTIAPNGSQIVFQLRQGITFQDGTAFNATAVKFSYDRAILINHADGPQFLLAPNITMAIRGGPEYYNANTVHNTNTSAVQAYLNAGGVKILGTYSVEFNFEHPYPPEAALGTFAWESGGAIVSPSYVIKNCPGTSLTPGVTPGFECTFMETHMMGTGPYMLQTYTPDSEIVFTRYDNYWGTPSNTGPAKLQEYIVKYVSSISTAELDLYSGTTDAISVPTSNAFDLINQQIYLKNGSIVPTKQGVRVWAAPTNAIATMLMDPRIKPFDNLDFRMAMAYAFPYQEFLQNVTNGFSVPLSGYLTPTMFGYDSNLTGYDYNPTMAKQLFQQAGYTGNITLIVENNDATNIEAAVLFKSSVQTIDPSISVTIQEVGTATYLTMYNNFQIPISIGCCWVPDIADGSETLSNFASPSGFAGETTELNNATVVGWLNEAAGSLNQTLRAELYGKVQQAMLAWAGIIPLYSPDAIQAERTWVLPTNSSIGRGLYDPQDGDGSGGSGGGYEAYYINKANFTQYPIAISAILPVAGLKLSPSSGLVIGAPIFLTQMLRAQPGGSRKIVAVKEGRKQKAQRARGSG